ncbi:unnamed protein product [Brassica napus]|uniref:(rape) hypothetical protein n=1 Tax=Brassica napus TaxID=3708 RepID=A0A817B1C0_BRANA|nr:unnamed protein product [Brassica napus]
MIGRRRRRRSLFLKAKYLLLWFVGDFRRLKRSKGSTCGDLGGAISGALFTGGGGVTQWETSSTLDLSSGVAVWQTEEWCVGP